MRRLLLGLSWSALSAFPLAAQRADFSDLDGMIEKALVEWKTPGLILSIVRNDSVVLSRGYGVREAGKPERVDENTVFSIGSCSKAFTSALLTGLVGEKRLDWEDKAIEYLPWFRVWEPWVSEEITVRDLMAHRVGYDLQAENRLWLFSKSMRDLVERGGKLPPAVGFRERYRYSNNMFVAAGLVAETVTGTSWAEAVEQRIFKPLGMVSSSSSVARVLQNPNRGSPHTLVDEVPQPHRWGRAPDSILGPTGGINSSARDMAAWLRFQLGKGRIGNGRLIDSTVFAEQHIPHTPIRGGPVEAAYWFAHVDEKDLETRFWSYGLGWFVVDYRNRPLVWHGGTIDGFRCAIAMLPEENAGMYIGVNRVTLLPPMMMLTVLDRLIGRPGPDWRSIFLREAAQQEADVNKAAEGRVAARAQNTRPSLPDAGYAASFTNPAFGPARVLVAEGKLALEVGPWRGQLEHWHHDTFRVRWTAPLPSSTFATFTLDSAGRVDAVTVESLLATFTRQPDTR